MKDKVYIGELSKQLNISKRTILYYEDIGLIKSIREPISNYRLYENNAYIRLNLESFFNISEKVYKNILMKMQK